MREFDFAEPRSVTEASQMLAEYGDDARIIAGGSALMLAMRQRMLDAHASNSEEQFDIKQDPGGLVDVEFIVQYLVLGHAHEHERLCGNLGNIALLGIAAELKLIPQTLADPVRNIYREFRRMQHAFRLNGIRGARVERDAYLQQIDAVRALWAFVFD